MQLIVRLVSGAPCTLGAAICSKRSVRTTFRNSENIRWFNNPLHRTNHPNNIIPLSTERVPPFLPLDVPLRAPFFVPRVSRSLGLPPAGLQYRWTSRGPPTTEECFVSKNVTCPNTLHPPSPSVTESSHDRHNLLKLPTRLHDSDSRKQFPHDARSQFFKTPAPLRVPRQEIVENIN